MTLSVVIPIYNEVETLKTILVAVEKVDAGMEKEPPVARKPSGPDDTSQWSPFLLRTAGWAFQTARPLHGLHRSLLLPVHANE